MGGYTVVVCIPPLATCGQMTPRESLALHCIHIP